MVDILTVLPALPEFVWVFDEGGGVGGGGGAGRPRRVRGRGGGGRHRGQPRGRGSGAGIQGDYIVLVWMEVQGVTSRGWCPGPRWRTSGARSPWRRGSVSSPAWRSAARPGGWSGPAPAAGTRAWRSSASTSAASSSHCRKPCIRRQHSDIKDAPGPLILGPTGKALNQTILLQTFLMCQNHWKI